MKPGGDDSDGELATRALSGEDQAFTLLMNRHKPWAFRFVRRYVGQADDALDVLQDTFFSAWLSLSSYQPERPFEAWLRRIALNKCRDSARRQRVRRMISVFVGGDELELPEVADTAATPEAALADAQAAAALAAAIRKLPRGLKEPLLLTSLEGLSHREAGELLGLNAKAVEMRIYRARAQLNLLLPQSRSS